VTVTTEHQWYHSTGQIFNMAPGFLDVARGFYQSALRASGRSTETLAVFQKWLGSVTALCGIVEDVEKVRDVEVPPKVLDLLDSHVHECLRELSEMRGQALPPELVKEATQLTRFLERTQRRDRWAEAWSQAREPVTSRARRLAEVVASAIGQVLRWLVRSLRR
jgi:hypothetical protein